MGNRELIQENPLTECNQIKKRVKKRGRIRVDAQRGKLDKQLFFT